jgi:hypothetical protein
MANDSLLPSPGTMAMGSFEPPRYNKSSTVAEKKKAAPALLDNLLHSILLCNIPTKSEWQWWFRHLLHLTQQQHWWQCINLHIFA